MGFSRVAGEIIAELKTDSSGIVRVLVSNEYLRRSNKDKFCMAVSNEYLRKENNFSLLVFGSCMV